MKHTSLSAITATLLLAGCGSSETSRIAKRMDGFDFANLPEYTGSYETYSGLYHDGLAYSKTKDSRGFVNLNGEIIVDLDGYRSESNLCFFSEGLLLAQNRKCFTAFNTKGDIVFESDGDVRSQMRGGYALCDINGDNRLEVINSKGEIIFESTKELYIGNIAAMCITTPASCARPSCFPVFTNHGDGMFFIDVATGERFLEGLIPTEVNTDGIHDFSIDSNDRVVLKTRDGYGLLKLDGSWAVEPQYSELINDGEWYAFRQDGLTGWLDKDGNVMIEPQFDIRTHDIAFGGSDFCRIDRHTVIDRKGNIAFETEHDIVTGFINDKCIVMVDRTHYQWMKSNGELVDTPLYLSENIVKQLDQISRGQAIQYSIWNL